MDTDPKAGEKAYYSLLGPDGRRHARDKPFSDAECGKYLSDIGALLLMLEPPPRSVIDFGCGAGWTSLFLARAGYEVLGVDISPDAIALARESAAATASAAEFAAADYEGFSASRGFDYALFYDSLHHAEDEQGAVTAAYRALKPGGVLFAFEPGAGHSRSQGARRAVSTFGVHEKDMSPAHIRRLGIRVGFERALWLPLPRDLARHVFRRDYLSAGPIPARCRKTLGLPPCGRKGPLGLQHRVDPHVEAALRGVRLPIQPASSRTYSPRPLTFRARASAVSLSSRAGSPSMRARACPRLRESTAGSGRHPPPRRPLPARRFPGRRRVFRRRRSSMTGRPKPSASEG